MIRTAIAVAMIFALTGCPAQQKVSLNDLRDEILPNFLTEEAIAQVGSVPMYSGVINRRYAFSVGDDWGSRLVSVAYGYGNERQVLLPYMLDEPSQPWVDLVTFHEYVHQADYDNLLLRSEFLAVFEEFRMDSDYDEEAADFDAFLEDLAGGPFAELVYRYDDGITREAMAYAIEFWADGCFDLPEYMLAIYDGVVLPNPPSMDDGVELCNLKSRPVPACAIGMAVREKYLQDVEARSAGKVTTK